MPSNLRQRLTTAAAKLREPGTPDPGVLADAAEAIDEALAPNGWSKLRRTEPTAVSKLSPNKSIHMERSLRTHLHQAAEAKGVALSDLAEEGLRLFIAGKYVPERPQRAATNPDERDSVTLNVALDKDLRAQADARGKELKDAGELDWAPKTTQIVKAYLLHVLPMPTATKAKGK
ncbi:hypothetical protein [Streptomyces sp. NPDC048516]|uniref:hypothetical protein n=1 Tax=Streptomyces sp. NPDC048516 TaxID=3365565 RepID=UPI00370FB9EA